MIASILIGLLVLLIVYWWASAGAWSAFLHMLCVVIAGALAFALWEPVAYLMVPTGFSDYALGTSLLGLFTILLVVLRLAVDRLVPANLQFPRAASFLVGGTFGLVSGVLTMGIFVIGCGFLQSSARVGDVEGWLRRSDVPKAPTIGNDGAPLMKLVQITTNFYGFLSWGSFTPWLGGGTLRTHHPDLARAALSLHRDSFNGGTGRTGIDPRAVSGLQVFDAGQAALDPGVGATTQPTIAVQFKVNQDGFDGNGQQFVLAASQAYLVGEGANGRATYAYPLAWKQSTESGEERMFFYNSPTNYATSVPGAGEASFTLLFPKNDLNGQKPRYVSLKGVRFPIQAIKSGGDALAVGGARPQEVKEDTGITALSSGIELPDPTWSLPNVLNSNDKGGLTLDGENYILSGEQRFDRKPSASVGEDLRIRGFKPAEGTRVVRVDCSATDGGVRLWPEVNEWVREAGAAAQDGRIALVDSKGVKYYAVGYAEDDGMYLMIKSSGGSAFRLRDVPIQTLGSNKKLLLYFRVPINTTLKYLALDTADGLRAVNTLNFPVPPKDALQ